MPPKKKAVSTANPNKPRATQTTLGRFITAAIRQNAGVTNAASSEGSNPAAPRAQQSNSKEFPAKPTSNAPTEEARPRNQAALVEHVPMPYSNRGFRDAEDLLLTEAARRAHPYYRFGDNPEAYEPDSGRDDLWFCALSFTQKEAKNVRSGDSGVAAPNSAAAVAQQQQRRRPIHEDSPENEEVYMGARVEINGVTPDGTTVCVVADNFVAYCYASIPHEWVEFYRGDETQLQMLCARWYVYMDEFLMRVVQHSPGFKRYRNCLYNGHVLMPLTEEERRCGLLRTDVKDIKCAVMDYRAVDPQSGESRPQHLPNYTVRLRVASPKLITLVRQHLWYPQGVDGSMCALCGSNDAAAPRIHSPFFPPKPDPENMREMLGEDWLARERAIQWTSVVRDRCGCAARFHGECLRNWARAQRLRGDLPRDSKYILRCPCCTSDVITIAECKYGFTHARSPLPSLAVLEQTRRQQEALQRAQQYAARRDRQQHEAAQEEADLIATVDDLLAMNADGVAEEQELEQDEDIGAKADGWNQQCDLYGWYDEFARREHVRYGCCPPPPQPTEAQEWEANLRARKYGTLPYPSSMSVLDANVGFSERFSIDQRIAPTTWVRVPCGKYTVIPPDTRARVSIAALEVHCDGGVLQRLSDRYSKKPPKDPALDTPEWKRARELYIQDVPPVLALIYDGEMSPDDGKFPHPHVNQTLQWGFLVHNMRTGHVVTVLMTLGELSEPPKRARPDIPCHVYSFKTHEELLRNICMFVRVLRPSVHIHWNGNSFDLPWLYECARYLGLCCARDFGSRIKGKDLFWKDGQGAGKRTITQVYMSGVTCLDGMLFAQVERSTLPSYSLNYLGEILLGQHKVDLNHERIPEMQKTADGRAGLAEYLMGDIYLTWCICIAMNMLPNLAQRSQLTYTTIQNLIQRGTQYMELNLLRHRMHRKAMNRMYGARFNLMALPSMRSPHLDPVLLAQKGRKAEYDGAVVIEPEKGFYDQVVATLDYASLYPSLMCHYNLCLSTAVQPLIAEQCGVVHGQHTWQRPNHVFHQEYIEEIPCATNPIFTKHHVFAGVFPAITTWLKGKRKAVKREMAIEEDLVVALKREGKSCDVNGRTLAQISARIKVLDIIQNQIKLAMNSIYGFMGLHRTRGQAALPTTAETVTLMGQHAIHTARITTELNFRPITGYRFRLRIIYGDTDSVFPTMIQDGTRETYELSRNKYLMIEIGVQMARAVTQRFGGGLELQFEKIYFPFLLMGKKNYIGNKIEPNGSKKIDKKGIRAKRRDCCDLQREATKIVEQYVIESYDFKVAMDKISAILGRIQRNQEPLHRAVFSGSFSGSLLDPKRTWNAPSFAVLKLYRATGQLTQPGSRVNYIFAEQPRLKRDAADKINRVTQSAETLERAQQHGIRYDRAEYIDRVIKSVLPMMSHVGAAEWHCSFDEAEKRLTKFWLSHVENVERCVRFSTLSDGNIGIKRLLHGGAMRINRRCVSCKSVMQDEPPQAVSLATAADACTLVDLRETVPLPSTVEWMSVRSMGNCSQLRVSGVNMRALLERWTVRSEWIRGGPADLEPSSSAIAHAEIRMSGAAITRTLLQWTGGRDFHVAQQPTARICPTCQERTRECQQNQVLLHEEYAAHVNDAAAYWDKCRSCSAARMRAADTVAQCTTYACDVYSNTAHYSRQAALASENMRERWITHRTVWFSSEEVKALEW